MKKYIYIPFVLLAAFLFTGCPYSAEVAIDQPSVKIDEKLLGKWEGKSSSDYIYTVTKLDDKTYQFDKKSASSGDVTTYNGFLSEVNGTRFINIYEVGSDVKTYYFYKVEITTSGAKTTLTPVTENIDEKFTSSTDLKDFFKKNMANSYFFDKEEDVYIKAD
jgi:virulence-associated protein VagC